MSYLQIIKASAGSGKTFSLTGEYLKLILSEPLDYYRKILAVTFTNKATAEMKSRILEELYLLGYNKESNHLINLIESSGKDEKSIREKSRAILNQILHGYSWFKVETIDSFFQGVIRSFIHELGIPGNQKIELDTDLILDKAIDRFLEKTGTNPMVTEWLLEYVEQKIGEGKTWLIQHELKKLGTHLFKEKINEHAHQLEEHLDSNSIKQFRNKLQSIKNEFENKILLLANKAIEAIKSSGYSIEDFSNGKRGAAGYFYKLCEKDFQRPGKRALEVLETPDKWVTKKASRREELVAFAEHTLNPVIVSVIDIFDVNEKDYISASAILKNFHVLGILFKISEELRELQKEENVLFISDAAPFIFRIINNNDTPFIYEKTGNRFNHLLIDEFQDTSGLQWKNFNPLISNSLSNGHECLLVGDIKQSIYRWRNSDWEILANKVKSQYQSETIRELSLQENYRSDALIINFNNNFFSNLPDIANQLISEDFSDFIPISSIYADAIQKIPVKKNNSDGFVQIKLFDRKDTKDDETYYHSSLIDTINQMLENGFKPGDIALLVRTKAEGASVADIIIESNKEKKFRSEIGVISNESLFLKGSASVKMILAALKLVSDPNDKLAAAALVSGKLTLENLTSETVIFPTDVFKVEEINTIFNNSITRQFASLRMENLYLMAVKLISLLELNKIETEKVYIHSFLELVFQYSTSELSDLAGFLQFWEEEGGNKTISAAESESSVRILTIHKSKGLQFPVVIIPFADWSIEPKTNEILWVEPNTKPFDDFELLPLNFTKSLANSHFAEDYRQECYHSLIDNLNLLYVAFTRPETALIAFSRFGSGEKKTTGDLIKASLHRMFTETPPIVTFLEENNSYFINGHLKVRSASQTSETVMAGSDSNSVDLPKVRINRDSVGFIRKNNHELDPRLHGRILHSIMETIKVKSDIRKSVDQVVMQGKISKSEGELIFKNIHDAIAHEKIDEWFSGQYNVINENDIIGSAGKIKRPDRIMIKDKKAIVVDYKFGKDDDYSNHIQQVQQYLNLLKEMDFTDVSGFLWYVMNNELEEVKL